LDISIFLSFWDPFTYTSTGKLWLHDLTQEIDSSVIIPLLSMKEIEEYSDIIVHKNVYGICTDYPILF